MILFTKCIFCARKTKKKNASQIIVLVKLIRMVQNMQSQLHIFTANARTVIKVDTTLTTRIISRLCDKNTTPRAHSS